MQLQIWEKRCKWHSSHHLVFVYSGYNIATNVRCCFGKHSKLADKLRPPPLAGSGGQVGAFHIFQSNVLNLKKAMTHWSVCVCVCVCVTVDLLQPTHSLRFTSLCFCFPSFGGRSCMWTHGEVRDVVFVAPSVAVTQFNLHLFYTVQMSFSLPLQAGLWNH